VGSFGRIGSKRGLYYMFEMGTKLI
jgi:hypothetical protein